MWEIVNEEKEKICHNRIKYYANFYNKAGRIHFLSEISDCNSGFIENEVGK